MYTPNVRNEPLQWKIYGLIKLFSGESTNVYFSYLMKSTLLADLSANPKLKKIQTISFQLL